MSRSLLTLPLTGRVARRSVAKAGGVGSANGKRACAPPAYQFHRCRTESFGAFWRSLRPQGLHFRRQLPIDHLIVDFACFSRASLSRSMAASTTPHLVSASIARATSSDARTISKCCAFGITMYSATSMASHTKSIRTRIACRYPHPHPLPARGRGGVRRALAATTLSPGGERTRDASTHRLTRREDCAYTTNHAN